MLIKKAIFNELSGFDTNYREFYYDIDLCLRARQLDKLIVWTPYAAAYALDAVRFKSREDVKKIAMSDLKRIDGAWGDVLQSPDPYYNKNFSKERADFST